MKLTGTTSLARGVLAISCFSAMWRIHHATLNWCLHFLSGSLPISNTPVFALIGFFFILSSTTFGIIQNEFKKPDCRGMFPHESTSWFASNVGLSFLTVHFNVAYEKFFFAWFQLVNFFIVACASWVLPIKLTKILRHMQQAAAVMSIVIVSFLNQNWHGVLGAQLIAIATLSIGTEGTLFGFPAIDAFHCVLACAAYLLSKAVTIVNT